MNHEPVPNEFQVRKPEIRHIELRTWKGEKEQWQVERKNVKYIKDIGEGYFANVWLGKIEGLNQRDDYVAIKEMKSQSHFPAEIEQDDPKEEGKQLKHFVSEIEIMKRMKAHPHIINLLGTCVDNGPLWIVMEYAPNGSLKEYLIERSGYGMRALPEKTLLEFAHQVADAMKFLSSEKLLHRDLTTSNVLVTEEEKMKLADFGFAKYAPQNYYRKECTNYSLPFNKVAPEVLADDGLYSIKSDVWAFGILLWEVMTMGLGNPSYSEIGTPEDVLHLLKNEKRRLPKDELFYESSYPLMLECWQDDPNDRPDFQTIQERLSELKEKCTESILSAS